MKKLKFSGIFLEHSVAYSIPKLLLLLLLLQQQQFVVAEGRAGEDK